MLSAGTDGIDGNSPAAGAIVDGTRRTGHEPVDWILNADLSGFNAYPFFESLGDAIDDRTHGKQSAGSADSAGLLNGSGVVQLCACVGAGN